MAISVMNLHVPFSDESQKDAKKLRKSATRLSSPKNSVDYQPTPWDFDEFVPWMCLQYQSPQAANVTRIYQEDYVRASMNRRVSTKTIRSFKARVKESQEVIQNRLPAVKAAEQFQEDECIQIKAYYNIHGHDLQEVSIVDSQFLICRPVMQILCMTIPFHQTLFKLTISKGGLTATGLHEIREILPQSYLTEICFDDTYIPQQNYTVLLEARTRLRNLSLNRCRLGDETCKKIVAYMDIGAPSAKLRTLELSTNEITDEGAFAFAKLLRRNRRLLHLNLSGNRITEYGAGAILDVLKEFPMTSDEISTMKHSSMEYNREKIRIYERYLKDMIMLKHRPEARSKTKTTKATTVSSKIKSPVAKKTNKKTPTSPTTDVLSSISAIGIGTIKQEYAYPQLEQKAREAIGKFVNPYNAEHTVYKDKCYYCVGNMFLCSLNLAYNNLDYSSVEKIHTVLKHQAEVNRPSGSTGLLRINFDGNNIPRYCEEYLLIEMLLNNAVSNLVPRTTRRTVTKNTLQRKST